MPSPRGCKATRQAILDAALKNFARCGYAGANIQQIAADAGVAKPALYYHFGSKAGLFAAVIDQAEHEAFSTLSKATGPAWPWRRRMTEVCMAAFRLVTRHPDVVRLVLGRSLLAHDAPTAENLRSRKTDRCRRVIRNLVVQGMTNEIIRKDLDAEQLSLGFWGMLQSQLLSHLGDSGYLLNRRKAKSLVNLFLAGALAAKSARHDAKGNKGTLPTGFGAAQTRIELPV